MKRTLYFVFLLMLVCVFALSACNTNPPSSMPEGDDSSAQGTKQVPIYQGMTITDSNTSTLSLTSDSYHGAGIMLLSSNNANNGNNGNHYGHHKGDCADDRDDFNKNDPYPDNNEKIEDEIRDSLNVIGSSKEIYYATTNQDIYINIHISNPDKYEILSFTLNGEKYSSYMFEQGSTLETLILKVNVGNASGIVEYTIDQIKYVDGTEIKDVKIDGEKTVKAGIKTENQVSGIVSNVNIGTNNISFDAKITDKDSLIAYSNGAIKAVLYDGEELIATKDIFVGENDIVFDALKTNSVYQYAIVAFYDDLSGNGVETHILSKEAFYTNAVVLFDNIAVGKVNTTFEFKWDESVANKALTSLKLYQGETLVRELAVNATSIDGLLSGADYSLIAEYQNLGKTESIKLEFTTLVKEAYVFSITNPTKTQTSVGFEISETDADNIGVVTKIELLKEGQVAKTATSLDVRSFDGLLSNNTYTVKVTYTYNLNDGAGDQTAEKTLDIKTDAKATPVISITNPTKAQTSVGFEISETDADNIGVVTKIELLKEGQVVTTATSLDARSFDGLISNTTYNIKVTYSYNLNDGNGDISTFVEFGIQTLPTLSATNCNVINTSPVSEGETIYLQVSLNNPSRVLIKKVIVNDLAYSVTSASNATTAFVEITHSNQFLGGETSLNVDGIICDIDGAEYTIEFSSNCSDVVFINGILECVSIDFADSNLNVIDWCFPNETVNLLITLNNPTGYTMDEIVINNVAITNLVKLSDNIYYAPVSISQGFNTKILNSISYSNESITKTVSYANKKTSIYKVASNETKYISNRNDLLSMTNGYYYVLANDIDLSGSEWIANDFVGVFDGNGHSIKNMTVVTTFKNQSVELGLFSTATGVIKDLTIENTMCIVELISDDGKQYDVKFGNIASTANDLIISNCNVKASCVIDIKNKTYVNGSVDYNGVGGIIGYLEDFCDGFYVKNTSCYASISLQYDGGTYYSGLGGILGSSRGGESGVYMKNIIFGGKLSKNGSFGCGGLVGRFGFEVVFVCENALVYGEIDGYDGIGDGWLGEPQFINCLFLSTGRVSDYTCSLINSYKLTDFQENEELLNDKDFYISTMKYDESIWNLNDLSLQEQKYPQIK